jgi:RNA polymerase sigma-70 factor (ECF subfamily)
VLTARELEAERRLIEASQREPRHFVKLYEHYFDRVYAFALTRTGDRPAAEDVTAETFKRAFENLRQFQWWGVPFSAWLFRVAANAACGPPSTSQRALRRPPSSTSATPLTAMIGPCR